MISARSISDIFDEWCTDLQPEMWEEDYGFQLRVVVSRDIPPRHSSFTWMLGFGVNKYDEIFSGTLDRLPEEWFLSFPERWISMEEQQKLIYQLVKLNKEKKLGMKKLDILTSAPFIISDTHRECLSIISFPKGKKTYDQQIA